MVIYNIGVSNRKLDLISQTQKDVVGGNKGYMVQFTFDREWENHKKVASFIFGGEHFLVEFEGDVCDVPPIFNSNSFRLGVYVGEETSEDTYMSTDTIEIPCKVSVRDYINGTNPNGGFGGNYTYQAKQYADESKKYADETRYLFYSSSGIMSKVSKNDKRITNLEQGITPDPFYTDDGVAYVKSVPDNALPYAEVNKVGGKVTEIKSVGNNRFNIANLNSAMIVQGNAFTVPEGNYNRDIFTDTGGFTTSVPMEYLDKLPYLEAGDYTLSWDEGYDQQNHFSICTVNHLDGTIIKASDGWRSGQTFNVPSDSLVTFRRGNNISKTYTNFRITRESSTSPYKPYVEHSFKIPLDVQQLKGYGEGDNYVDLENREFVAYYYDGEYHDKPVVTDLSSTISEDNYIEVEGGGAITAVNEGENPAKTEITYMLEVTA